MKWVSVRPIYSIPLYSSFHAHFGLNEAPTQRPGIPTESRPTDRTPSNIRFLEVCRQEEQFASRFIAEESTRAFELVIARSKTVEGATVKEEFHFRIERLYYEEKVPDIIQSKVKADLGSQHAATFVGGQCQTFDRLLESGVPGSQDLATESSQIGKPRFSGILNRDNFTSPTSFTKS
jgi:hypothetical protein